MKAINRELAAEVLLAAAFTTDAEAVQKYGVSLRSLQRWRRQLADGDPILVASVATKKAAFDAAWAESMPRALAKGIETIEKCFREIGSDAKLCKNPAILHSLAGAFRIVADVYLTNKIIHSRYSTYLRPLDDPTDEESRFSN